MSTAQKSTKTHIHVRLTEEDMERLEKLSNGYGKSACISNALRSLEREINPLIKIGFGKSFDKVGDDI